MLVYRMLHRWHTTRAQTSVQPEVRARVLVQAGGAKQDRLLPAHSYSISRTMGTRTAYSFWLNQVTGHRDCHWQKVLAV